MRTLILLLLLSCTGGAGDPAASGDTGACEPTWWYVDNDGDGWGDGMDRVFGCRPGDGYALDYPDCDDTDPSVYPGAVETWYDGVDNDCDGGANDDDADGDGADAEVVGGEDCDDTDAGIHPDAVDVCGSGVDEDCDGEFAPCGFTESMRAGDAAVHIVRDPDYNDIAEFGMHLEYAGDGDGDGINEFIVRVSGDDVKGKYGADDYKSAYFLVEPEADGGGDIETQSPARWTLDQQEWYSESYMRAEAGYDVDGDGYLDYFFSTKVYYGEDAGIGNERASQIHLSHGPALPFTNLDDDVPMLEDPPDRWDVRLWNGAIKLLDPPYHDDDWTLVASHWASLETGAVRPVLHLVNADNFEGKRTWDDAPVVWSPGGEDYDAGLMHDVGDVDGDGIADIIIGSAPVSHDNVQPPLFWILRGPDFADRNVIDADIVVAAPTGEHSYLAFKLLDALDRSGHPVVTARLETNDGVGWFFYELPESGTLDPTDAYTAVVETDGYGINGDLAFGGDLDADGADELAIGGGPVGPTRTVAIMDVPEAGTISISDYDVLIDQDEPVVGEDPVGTDFNEALLSNVDFNADGFPDLLISEPFWDDDIIGCCSRYGRLSLFHGGPVGF